MRLCFFIAAHNLPDMLRRAFDSVYDKRHSYIIHIDRKAQDKDLLQTVDALACLPNVYRLPRLAVSWGGFSQVRMELAAVCAALDSGDWSYFISMSGTDLLVRPLSELEELLARAGERSFIDRRRISELPDSLRARVRRRSKWVRIESMGRLFRLPIPLRALGSVPEYYGAQWHFLHRSLCEDIIRKIDDHGIPIGLRRCMIPDEVFWQNILNDESGVSDRIIGTNQRFAVFDGAPSPRWITAADIPRITAAGAYMARKFHPELSADALEHFKHATVASNQTGLEYA